MTDTATTIDAETTVGRYLDAWNASPQDRPALVEAVFSPDAYYCDGASEVAGHLGITAMMDGIAERFPGSTFTRSSAVDTHHSQARFAWTLTGADGTTIVDGIDAMRLAPDGRITVTLGFFGIAVP
ncbi:MAG: nuclear transport factor 2 family protein [Acidimicrobiales bacterium]